MSANTLANPPAASRTLRVLLIEDSVDDAMLLDRQLRRAGFAPSVTRIETAEAMQTALAADPRGWDIILADYNLPRFSAPEALQLLKSTAQDIPFIMMSGAVSEETAVAAMRAGAHDYVSKENLARLAPAIEREIAEAASRRRKQAAERALALSEERFHRLVEATPLALLISDMEGRVVYANAGVERLLGYRPHEVERGLLMLDRILPTPAKPAADGAQGAQAQRERDAAPRETGQKSIDLLVAMSLSHPGETVEYLCVDAAGATLPVLLGAAILNPESPDGEQQLAAFLVDLSEQKRGEEVLRRTEKLAAAGRLAASIAHEINNPLEAITNCIYLLGQTELPADAREYLRLARQELDRVTHITTQTLRFYRQSTRPGQTNIPELLETVLALYEARLRDHGIDVVRDYWPLPLIVIFDGEIRQVLANLVGNALDAMATAANRGRGRLILRLRLGRDWKTGEPRVAIVIADTGTGMSRETLRRIYEPFFSTKGITGTGLGLWVSQGIVVKHRGRLAARSRQKPPSGTVFRLLLPLESELGAGEPLIHEG